MREVTEKLYDRLMIYGEALTVYKAYVDKWHAKGCPGGKMDAEVDRLSQIQAKAYTLVDNCLGKEAMKMVQMQKELV